MKPEKVYAVVSQFPVPLDRGDAVRTVQILQALNSQFDLTVLSVLREDTAEEDVLQLAQLIYGAEILTYAGADVVRGSSAKRLMRWAKSIASQEPPWILGRRSSELKTKINSLANADAIFVAVSEASGTYIDSNKTWHWDKMNVLGESSKIEIKTATGLSAYVRASVIHRLCVKFEKRAIANSASISVTSDLELVRLQSRYDVSRNLRYVWPSCASVTDLGVPRRSNATRVAAWLGSLSYPSNYAGLALFLEKSWGSVSHPEFTLRIIGRGLSGDQEEDLQKRFPGIEFAGFVENLADALSDVQVAVAPLWSGAGVKMKTLTLMGFGIPVFGTSVAFEGIDVKGMDVTFEDPVQLMRSICDTSDEKLASIGAEMKEKVRQNHSPDALTQSVSTSVRNLVRAK